jgi:hypothetical protein
MIKVVYSTSNTVKKIVIFVRLTTNVVNAIFTNKNAYLVVRYVLVKLAETLEHIKDTSLNKDKS